MTIEEKREIVEEYLSAMCQEIALCEDANDPYPCEQTDEIIKECLGLISYTKYYPDQIEWHNFEPEGWLYQTPTDAQVEQLYPQAKALFEND